MLGVQFKETLRSTATVSWFREMTFLNLKLTSYVHKTYIMILFDEKIIQQTQTESIWGLRDRWTYTRC